jgi:hypothetical protein
MVFEGQTLAVRFVESAPKNPNVAPDAGLNMKF